MSALAPCYRGAKSEFVMEIIFFAVVAALVLGRLYQVLGQNRGAEPPPNRNIANLVADPAKPSGNIPDGEPQSEDSNVIQLKPRVYDGPGAAGILAISAAQKGFSIDGFVDGARQAYGMIVTAYGSGDAATLKPLVDQDVFEAYQAAMADRLAGNAAKIEVVRISEAKIVDAELNGKRATIDIAFSADLAEGNDGLRAADEIWTFERNIDARDPNWLLSAVQTK
jgi:predicted lipid-binding transport protein (Tim44 family)